jgi:DNA-binding NarL/FixJ family response regulator
MIKVLVADGHPLVRSGIRDLLSDGGEIDVVECAECKDVLEAVEKTDPDVVLMDLVTPRWGGLEGTRALQATYPRCRVIVMVESDGDPAIDAVKALGVAAYVVRGEDPGSLRERVRQVAAHSVCG